MKRYFIILLAALLVLSLAACQEAPAETTVAPVETTVAPVETTVLPTETTAAPTETTAPVETEAPTEPLTPEEQILQERRDIVEAYMRQQTTILWRCEEDLLYTIASNVEPENADSSKQIQLVAGRLYMGLPYAYTSGTVDSFLEYAGKPDENGIYTISDLSWEALSGSSKIARLGNDCSAALVLAWSQVGGSVSAQSTQYMCEDYGFLRVGDYESDPSDNTPTTSAIARNGMEKMLAAYAQLQKGDGLVCRAAASGHAVMVVDVEVVYLEDGSIDTYSSYVTILEQTSTSIKAQTSKEKHPVTGEPIYQICGVDRAFTFRYLIQKGYLPITCKELVDPSPLPEKTITDSETAFHKDTILSGVLSSDWYIDAVTVTLTDSTGAAVQEAMAFATRKGNNAFDMQKFVNDHPTTIRGSIDPAALASGNYHCTVVCRLTTGDEIIARDFDFVV